MFSYRLFNKLLKKNNKKYIGGTKVLYQRYISHKNGHSNAPRFTNAIQEYGFDNFEFSILEECTLENLKEREEYWIKFYKTTDTNNGYNIWEGEKAKRLPRTQEVKDKIIQTLNKNFPEGRIGENNASYGKNHSEESKKLIGEKSKGRIPVHRKPILAFNQNNNKKFDCMTHAAKEFNISRAYINKLIKENKSYNGYFFKYI